MIYNIYTAKEFKRIQAEKYEQLKKECAKNNVLPPKSIACYFPFPPKNYGYVMQTKRGYEWRKTKKELINC